jgi:hypothetical protein
MSILKWFAQFVLIAVLAFGFAYMFLLAWDDEPDSYERTRRRMSALDTEAPASPTGVRPNYGEPSTRPPKVTIFQDASKPKGGK